MISMGKPKAPEEGEVPEDVVKEASEEGEAPAMEMAEKRTYDIPVPKGYEPPQGSEDGKDFDEVVKFRIGEDGSLQIVKIGSVNTDESEPTEEAPAPENNEMEVEPVEPSADKALSMAMNRQRGR